MSSRDSEHDLINELLTRIKRLELNEAALQREVSTLQHQLQETEAQLEQHAIPAEIVPINDNIGESNQVLDRDDKEIHIGDIVETLAKGAFKERRGRVHKIELPWVYITDRTGQEQRHIPTNLRIVQSWNHT